MNFYSKIIILTTSILCFSSCMGTDEAELAGKFLPPQVSAGDATINKESTTVVLNALYKQSSTSAVIDEVGFYYGEDPDLTAAEKIVADSNNDNFSVKILPNTYGKEFFYKAYLSNGRSEVLSSVKSFIIPEFDYYVTLDAPKVIAVSRSNVMISSAFSKADGVSLSESGIYYSADKDITKDGTKIVSDDSGIINVEIKGLTIGSKYYMRSYIMDREYIAFSELVEFIPLTVPYLTTVNVSSISYTTAISGGSFISDNGLEVTSKGVVWNTNANPTIDLTTKTENGSGKQDYVASIEGLSPGTKYYLRAYAINPDGVEYGNEITFETLSQSIASVTTATPSEVTSTSAISGGNVTSDGGAEVTMRGVVWGKEHNPTISLDTKTADNSGIGKFTSAITGLEPETKYYLRAYAINSEGVSYGNEITFETLLKGDCYIDEYGVDHGKGTEIDGVVWAPVNCGYHEADFKYGKLYQWGREYGQGYDGYLYDINGNKTGTYTDAIVPTVKPGRVSLGEGQSKSNEKYFYFVPKSSNFDCDWLSPSNEYLWSFGSEYDPCPDGWRVPTYMELYKLNSNKSSWTTENDQVGYWFSGSATYSSFVPRVFFPAAGIIYGNNGEADERGLYGYYWSSGANIALDCRSYAEGLVFEQGISRMGDSYYRAGGWSVRCVQE